MQNYIIGKRETRPETRGFHHRSPALILRDDVFPSDRAAPVRIVFQRSREANRVIQYLRVTLRGRVCRAIDGLTGTIKVILYVVRLPRDSHSCRDECRVAKSDGKIPD